MESENKQKKTIKIAILSDLHVEFLYKIGSNAYCESEPCCREDSG